MKILSIDTASNICGVSILEDSNLICTLDTDTGRTHSENLMPIIKQAFEQSNLTLKDIDLLVCDKGPGSFTGIRIGVATIKAFHDSLDIPCCGISSLEALAYNIRTDGLICSIIDSKNNNCYFGLYERKNGIYTELIEPQAETIECALAILNSYCDDNFENFNITFVGDGCEVYKDYICEKFKNAILADSNKNILNSYNLGLAGLYKFKENILEDALPLYLKKPQAQKLLEEKTKNIKINSMNLDDYNQISDEFSTNFDSFWDCSILKDELKCNNSHYLVAKNNNEVVGFIGIKTMIDEADIMNIVVRNDFRNQGVGTLLLENIITLCKKLNLNYLTLEVNEENCSAIHLYKKFGFEKVGIRKNYYKDKNGLIMKKKLT